jgi:pyrroloquinoline quinone biosynthesis protein B
VLLNASPDLRQQMTETPELAPLSNGPARSSPIAAVVLTNADVDHVVGLLSLREGFVLNLYATASVLDTLAANSIFNVLQPGLVARIPVLHGKPIHEQGLSIEAFVVPGKVALYLEQGDGTLPSRTGDTVGLTICEAKSGTRFVYVPGCAAVDEELARRLRAAPLVLFDGTLYTDDEMRVQGLSDKTGLRMGHMAISGPAGSMAALRDLDIGRRIYIHLNNSNPVLREGSSERAEVEREGWEIAFDGMEIRL